MTIFEFSTKIEEILENEVQRLLPGYWNEDQLTINLLLSLCSQFSNVRVEDLHGISKVSLNAFKQSGSLTETKFGDIAIIVKISYPDRDVIEGVGYLEAKKRTLRKNTFDATSTTQLKRINKNVPRARLLLYDYDPIVKFISTYMEEPNRYNRFYRELRYLPVTHSVALPLNLALKAGHFDTDLYKFGLPFSHQLAYRYMYAQDLEFEEEVLKASKGFSDRQNLSKYILTISIYPQHMDEDNGIIVNEDFFERLK